MVRQENGIPMGFKFNLTSFEVIQLFPYEKLLGLFSTDRIIDLDVYQFDPDQLPLDHSPQMRSNEGYFFAPKENRNSQRRETPNGYWQITKENVPVYNSEDEFVGFKNKLLFYRNGIETDWRMSEYRCNIDSNENVEERYIVCKVRFKVKVDETVSDNVDETYDDFPKEQEDDIDRENGV